MWEGPTSNVWTDQDCLLLGSLRNVFNDAKSCKTECKYGRYNTCNAVVLQQTPGWCDFYECPNPVPKPSEIIDDSVGYYFDKGK